MSIINRLKSLFTGDKKEDIDIIDDTSNDVNSSSNEFEDTVVSESKTTEGINKTIIEVFDEDENNDIITSDIAADSEIVEETIEVNSEKIVDAIEEEDVTDEDVVPVVVEDDSIDEVKVENNDSNNNDKKRDNMTLLTDKELLKDENRDPEFTAEFIDAGIETVKHCFQCGTCSGGCPSGRRTPYKVRQIVRKCLLGLKDEVISDDALWMCTTCYTCQERCPRSVKIVEIIKKARNIAAHAGYMAKAHKMTGSFVIKTGHGVPINDATKALRTQIGLSEVPVTTHADEKALEEVQKLCKITGFDELIGYDEATGGIKE